MAQEFRTPFDCGLGYIVKYTDHSRNESRQEVDYPQTREEDDEPRFTVKWYVNGENTYTISTLRASHVYDQAVPPEALLPVEGNRWHVMMREAALKRMLNTRIHESFTLCFQDHSPNPELDREMIIVTCDWADVYYE